MRRRFGQDRYTAGERHRNSMSYHNTLVKLNTAQRVKIDATLMDFEKHTVLSEEILETATETWKKEYGLTSDVTFRPPNVYSQACDGVASCRKDIMYLSATLEPCEPKAAAM